MSFLHLDDIESREVIPGFHGKMIHTEHNTIAHWQIEEGASLPPHSHPHEQVTMVQSGTFEFNLAGEIKRCEAGDVVVIAGGVEHGGTALTACTIIDTFAPVREEYR